MKQSQIGETVTVIMDRKIGSVHPDYPEHSYPVNYGYVPGVMAGDGEEQDAYVLGVDVPLELFTGTVIAVIHRLDDLKDKWVVAPEGIRFTKEEIERQVLFQERFFSYEIDFGPLDAVLETGRLLLRPSELDLAGECASYYQRNAEFLKKFEPERPEEFYTREYQQDILRRELEDRRKREGFSFYLFLKEEPKTMIGKIGLNNMVWGGFCSCFLGYKLDRKLEGNGLMTEAVTAVVPFGFDRLGLHRIEANVMPRNTASLRVLEKCGFEREGVSRKYLRINGVWEDHVHMVRLNEEECCSGYWGRND